jgi:hypothetical protein
MTVHLTDLMDWTPAVRDAVAAATRTFGADFATNVYGDSRRKREPRESVELADAGKKDFVVIVVAKDVLAEAEEPENVDSRYTVRFVNELWLGQKAGEGTDEDAFALRLGLLTLKWAARKYVEVTLDDLTLEFRVGQISTVAEIDNDTIEGRDVKGLFAGKRIEVIAEEVCRA